MWDSNEKLYYQRKIEETTWKIKENNPNLQHILTQEEYELFSELCDHISDKHSCTEAMDIIYTRMTILLKQSVFSDIKFTNICAMVNELGGKPFWALYECYQINSIDHEQETIKIESVIESFRIYSKNIDLISEELYDIQQQSDNPIIAHLYHLSELFGYFFYKHMESIVSDKQYIHISNSYKQILDSIIELQTYNPSLQKILNSPSGTQLMTIIFSQEYLSDKNVNHWQSIYLMLWYIYIFISLMAVFWSIY